MKKILYCLISGALLMGFASCDPQDNDSHSLLGELVAQNGISFSVAPTENQNEYVFTNTTGELPSDVQLFWDFGDGKAIATKTGDAVTKVYKKAGTYTVKILAFTTAGQSEFAQTVNVAEDLKDDSFKWMGFGYDSSANLFKDATYTNEYYYAHTSEWKILPNPTPSFEDNKAVVTYPTATDLQWQNQFHFITNIAISASKTYDFSVALRASKDIPEATVKISKVGDDNTTLFLAEKSVSLKAGELNVVYGTALTGFDGNVKITFDFGGNPAETEVEIIDITLMEHNDDNVAPLDYNVQGNLWKAIDESKSYTMDYYWADGDDWHGVDNPTFDVNGNVYTVIAKASTKAQWQAQCTFKPNSLPIAASDTYDFSLIVRATKDCKMTAKLTDASSDKNYLFENSNIELKANVVKAITISGKQMKEAMDAANTKLVLDFGGCEEGTEFTIGDITLIKK